MRKIFIQSLTALAFMSLVTGLLYPLAVTLVARAFWPREASGSLVVINGKVLGSELLAQQFTGPAYFWPRPSASNYGTLPGAASNLGPTSQKLREAVLERRRLLSDDPHAPYELLLASGSGLDPHISPAAARYQVKRVAQHAGVPESQLKDLIDSYTEGPSFGILGKARVNVFKLNLALAALKK